MYNYADTNGAIQAANHKRLRRLVKAPAKIPPAEARPKAVP